MHTFHKIELFCLFFSIFCFLSLWSQRHIVHCGIPWKMCVCAHTYARTQTWKSSSWLTQTNIGMAESSGKWLFIFYYSSLKSWNGKPLRNPKDPSFLVFAILCNFLPLVTCIWPIYQSNIEGISFLWFLASILLAHFLPLALRKVSYFVQGPCVKKLKDISR